jgi:hypothetical protein
VRLCIDACHRNLSVQRKFLIRRIAAEPFLLRRNPPYPATKNHALSRNCGWSPIRSLPDAGSEAVLAAATSFGHFSSHAYSRALDQACRGVASGASSGVGRHFVPASIAEFSLRCCFVIPGGGLGSSYSPPRGGSRTELPFNAITDQRYSRETCLRHPRRILVQSGPREASARRQFRIRSSPAKLTPTR